MSVCYCDHDKGQHHKGRGACNAKGCDCKEYDRKPGEDDEPGTWLKRAGEDAS